jgi:hypothetical protein
MKIKWVLTKSVNPNSLGVNEIKQIAEVEKDMWAYWIGEYVKCNCCNKVHSKNDIFWHLAADIRKKSVTDLESIFLWDSINCKRCNSNDTDFLFDTDKNIEEIKKRYFESIDSFLALTIKEETWDIVWFMDWYIDNLKNIYDRELEYYYNINVYKLLEKYVSSKNWWLVPSEILTFSSMWLLEENTSFYKVFELIKEFFSWIDSKYDNVFWITEVSKWTNLHWFHHSMWVKELGFSDNPWIRSVSKNRWNNENSTLFYQKEAVATYKKRYNLPVKEYIRKNKKTILEVLVA